MKQPDRQKRIIRIVIIVLTILLVLSAAALAATLIFRYNSAAPASSVVVTQNLITPEPSDTDTASPTTADGQSLTDSATTASGAVTTQRSSAQNADEQTAAASGDAAVSLAIHKGSAEDGSEFHLENMLPGDSQTKRFRVVVSYRDSVTVRYHAQLRDGYDKLADALKIRIKLISDGTVLYDNSIYDMPTSLNHTLTSNGAATDELYYEITAYLETSVGNEYQNQSLIADFRWWVEETDQLEPSPDTGMLQQAAPLLAVGCVVLLALILLFTRRRKEQPHE